MAYDYTNIAGPYMGMFPGVTHGAADEYGNVPETKGLDLSSIDTPEEYAYASYRPFTQTVEKWGNPSENAAYWLGGVTDPHNVAEFQRMQGGAKLSPLASMLVDNPWVQGQHVARPDIPDQWGGVAAPEATDHGWAKDFYSQYGLGKGDYSQASTNWAANNSAAAQAARDDDGLFGGDLMPILAIAALASGPWGMGLWGGGAGAGAAGALAGDAFLPGALAGEFGLGTAGLGTIGAAELGAAAMPGYDAAGNFIGFNPGEFAVGESYASLPDIAMNSYINPVMQSEPVKFANTLRKGYNAFNSIDSMLDGPPEQQMRGAMPQSVSGLSEAYSQGQAPRGRRGSPLQMANIGMRRT